MRQRLAQVLIATAIVAGTAAFVTGDAQAGVRYYYTYPAPAYYVARAPVVYYEAPVVVPAPTVVYGPVIVSPPPVVYYPPVTVYERTRYRPWGQRIYQKVYTPHGVYRNRYRIHY